MNESLADQLVSALADVKRIGDKVPTMHPMRHAIRELKQLAENELLNAANTARRLALLAETTIEGHEEAMKKKEGEA